MLRGLRKASSNWVGKTIMGAVVAFLIGSFAIWGIGDIFRGFGLATLAKIGRPRSPPSNSARSTMTSCRRSAARSASRSLPTRRGRSASTARSWRSSPPRSRSTSGPARCGSRCRTPRSRAASPPIRASRRRPGHSTPSVSSRPSGRPAIRSSVSWPSSAAAPCATSFRAPSWAGRWCRRRAVEAMNRYQNEQRSAEYVLLGHAQAGDIPAPSPDVLAQYFEQRKILFRAPEYRKLQLLALIPSDQANWIEVSDDDVKRAYEDHRDSYGTPERRQLQQMVFPERGSGACRRRPHRRAVRALATSPSSAARPKRTSSSAR